MRILILGGSGMLGEALIPEGKARGHEIIAPPSSEVDIQNDERLVDYIKLNHPDLIINAAAMISHDLCERYRTHAYIFNARPVATLANICRDRDIKLVQISSDQCAYPLLNEYAKTKAAGECFALSNKDALIVRTNIVGPKNMEWAFKAIENDEPCTLYTNYTVSSIDIWSFSKALFGVLEHKGHDYYAYAIMNIASRESFSKAEFIQALAERMGRPLTNATMGKVVGRHPDLTLNVSEAEECLDYELPTMNDVINALVERHTAPSDFEERLAEHAKFIGNMAVQAVERSKR